MWFIIRISYVIARSITTKQSQKYKILHKMRDCHARLEPDSQRQIDSFSEPQDD